MYFVILFLLLGYRIVLFFHNSNSNHLIYSGVLQGAQFCLFKVAVLAYSAYSKIAKSSPPQMTLLLSLLIELKIDITTLTNFLCIFHR